MRTGTFLLACILVAWILAAGALFAEPRQYHFPVEYDPALLTWEEPHWDGSTAVDIGLLPEFPPGSPQRRAFYGAQVVAGVSGEASRLDNPRGGTAVLLHGDDNRTYYYAHLSRSSIDQPRRVSAGEPLGQIGRTGTWTQYLEPHLHLSIAEGHQRGFFWTADVPASPWLQSTFGLAPGQRFDASVKESYQPELPRGLPLFGRVQVTRTFAQWRRENPHLAGLTVAATRAGRVWPLRSPVTGVVRVHVDTPLGLRLQITNEWAGYTVVVSGPILPTARAGSVVRQGGVIGYAEGPLHYMVFAPGGAPVDPLTVPEHLDSDD